MTTTENQGAASSWEDRAHAAAMDLEAHTQLKAAKLDLRDRLVLEGLDTGHTPSTVAHVMHLSYTRVKQIEARLG